MPALIQKTMTFFGAVQQILTKDYPRYLCLEMKLMNFHSVAELMPATRPTTNGRKTFHQHASSSDQEILKYTKGMKSLDP